MSRARVTDHREPTSDTREPERLFHITDVRYLWQNEEKRLRARHAREHKYIEGLRKKEDDHIAQDLEDQICLSQMEILTKYEQWVRGDREEIGNLRLSAGLKRKRLDKDDEKYSAKRRAQRQKWYARQAAARTVAPPVAPEGASSGLKQRGDGLYTHVALQDYADVCEAWRWVVMNEFDWVYALDHEKEAFYQAIKNANLELDSPRREQVDEAQDAFHSICEDLAMWGRDITEAAVVDQAMHNGRHKRAWSTVALLIIQGVLASFYTGPVEDELDS